MDDPKIITCYRDTVQFHQVAASAYPPRWVTMLIAALVALSMLALVGMAFYFAVHPQ